MIQLKYIASIKKGIKDVGNVINKGVQKVWKTGKAVGKWVVEHKEDILKVVNQYIIGTDTTIYTTDLLGGEFAITTHEGGNIFVTKRNSEFRYEGWSLNLNCLVPVLDTKLSGKSWNPFTWKIQSQIKYTDIDTGVPVKGGGYIKKDGVGINGSYSGTSGNMPIELPSGIGVDDFASINWSLSYEKGFANWRQIGEGVISLAAIFAIVVFVADNFIGIGAADDLALIPLLGYVTSRIPALGEMLQNMFPQIALSCVN